MKLLAPARELVARGPRGTLAFELLLRQAAGIARTLPEPRPGSEVVLAFERDRGAFAAALLASWERGHAAVLSDDAGRERVAPWLARAGNVAFLHDSAIGRGTCVPELLARGVSEEPSGAQEPAPDRTALIARRHGAESRTEEIAWSGRELLDAIDRLAAAMALASGELVACALAPSELASALAALLVPLRVGALFCAQAPRALAASLSTADARTLVATPAQLRALAGEPAGTLGSLARVLCVDEEPEARVASLLRTAHGIRLAPLPGFARTLATPESTLRAAVEALDGVREATLQRLPDGEGLLVALAGSAPLAVVELHVASLAPPGVSVRVRVLPALPRDFNDRIAMRQLFAACGRSSDGRPLARAVVWFQVAVEADGTLRFRARLPANYAFFEGHFPAHPVLPGAAQVQELVLAPLRRAWPELADVRRMSGLKFLARILPEDELELVLKRDPERPECSFELRRGEARCSAGRISFWGPGGRAP